MRSAHGGDTKHAILKKIFSGLKTVKLKISLFFKSLKKWVLF